MSELHPRARRKSGFTLLHLVILLVLMSAGAAIAIPRFFGRDVVTLENGAVLLARDLRTAQNRAAFSREPLFLRFFENGDGYEVVRKSGTPIKDPRTGRPFSRHYSIDGVFEGLSIESVDAGDDRTIVLSALGETSDPLTVKLAFMGHHRVVHAARSTGLVTIEGTTSGFLDDGL